jgi:hypothetical protein
MPLPNSTAQQRVDVLESPAFTSPLAPPAVTPSPLAALTPSRAPTTTVDAEPFQPTPRFESSAIDAPAQGGVRLQLDTSASRYSQQRHRLSVGDAPGIPRQTGSPSTKEEADLVARTSGNDFLGALPHGLQAPMMASVPPSLPCPSNAAETRSPLQGSLQSPSEPSHTPLPSTPRSRAVGLLKSTNTSPSPSP